MYAEVLAFANTHPEIALRIRSVAEVEDFHLALDAEQILCLGSSRIFTLLSNTFAHFAPLASHAHAPSLLTLQPLLPLLHSNSPIALS